MKVRSGKIESPYRVLLMGPEGIGKSTFAADAEAPIVLDCEGSTDEIDIPRCGMDDGSAPATYAHALHCIEWLATNDHPFKTLVVDTVDWLNAWIEAHVCEKAGWDSIEAPGYGKGQVAAAEEWRRFLARLERLQRDKRMHVLLLGHAHVKRYTPPEGDGYDRFDLKMPEKCAALVREWSKACLFAQLEVVGAENKKDKKVRGISTGRRVLRTEENAAVRAKNRFDLPPIITFDRRAFATFDRYRRQDVDAEFERLASASADPNKVREWFAQQPNRAEALDALRARVAQEKSK